MTDPADATEADRMEQEAAVQPTAPELAQEVTSPPDDVPEADGIEQQLTAAPGGTGAPVLAGGGEADEYDLLEQHAAVPDDDDDLRG